MNLVSNGSFEDYWECPTSIGSVGDDQLERCKFWYKPTSATTDYYSSCQTDEFSGASVPNNWFGRQYAYDGNSYVGLIIYEETFKESSEYVQCKLIRPLESCHKYRVRFYASLADFSPRATSTLGLRIDNVAITKGLPLEFNAFELPAHISAYPSTIVDTVGWQLVEGIFFAKGGEQFLTIGRFIDTSLYTNSNIPFITNDCIDCQEFGSAAQYYIDSVSVRDLGIEANNNIPNVLTANDDNVNDYWYPYTTCLVYWKCSIIDRWGKEVFAFNMTEKGWNGRDFDMQLLTEGVYYYIVDSKEGKETGFIHLVR